VRLSDKILDLLTEPANQNSKVNGKKDGDAAAGEVTRVRILSRHVAAGDSG
jgi:hypothetical protein